MQTRLLALVVLAVSLTAFPQGKVTFGNDSTRLFVLGPVVWAEDSLGPISSGPLPSGVSIVASLYAGTSAGSLTLQTAVTLTGADWPSPGRMANKPVILTVPGGVAQTFQIVLCGSDAVLPPGLSGMANRFAFYPNGWGYFGTSGLFTAVPGTSLTYPFLYQTSPPMNSTWSPGYIYATLPFPEPSSFALLGLGLAVLFVQRRSEHNPGTESPHVIEPR